MDRPQRRRRRRRRTLRNDLQNWYNNVYAAVADLVEQRDITVQTIAIAIGFVAFALFAKLSFFSSSSKGGSRYGNVCSETSDCMSKLLSCEKVEGQKFGTCNLDFENPYYNLHKVEDQESCDCAAQLAIVHTLYDRKKFVNEKANVKWQKNDLCKCENGGDSMPSPKDVIDMVRRNSDPGHNFEIQCLSSAVQMRREFEKNGPFFHHFHVFKETFMYPDFGSGYVKIMALQHLGYGGAKSLGYTTFEVVGFGKGKNQRYIGEEDIPFVLLKTFWGKNFAKQSGNKGYLKVSEDLLEKMIPTCEKDRHYGFGTTPPRFAFEDRRKLDTVPEQVRNTIQKRQSDRRVVCNVKSKVSFESCAKAQGAFKLVKICLGDLKREHPEGDISLLYADLSIVQGVVLHSIVSIKDVGGNSRYFEHSIWFHLNLEIGKRLKEYKRLDNYPKKI